MRKTNDNKVVFCIISRFLHVVGDVVDLLGHLLNVTPGLVVGQLVHRVQYAVLQVRVHTLLLRLEHLSFVYVHVYVCECLFVY